MPRLVAISLACLSAFLSTGCTTLLGRAFKEAIGARSEARPVAGEEIPDFKKYLAVAIDEPRTDLGALVDPLFTAAVRPLVVEALMRVPPDEMEKWEKDHKEGEPPPKPVFPGGAPVLTMTPQVTFYKERGGLGSILGTDSYAVVLFWLREGDIDLGKIEVVTKSAASRTREEDMAKAMAKGLAKFLRERRAPAPAQSERGGERRTRK